MILPGSYANGFAPRDGQPLYPELWRGRRVAAAPCLGPTGLTLRDWSGFGNQLSLSGITPASDWVVSQGRYALTLDGVDNFVETGFSLAGETQVTISVWGFRATGASRMMIGDRSSGSGINGIIIDCFTDGNLYAVAANGSVTYGVISVTAFTGWHHYLLQYDGLQGANATRLRLWIDGIERTMSYVGTIPASIGTTGTTFRVGRWDTAYSTALIDDFSVFSLPAGRQAALLASRRGIAYELAPRRRSSVQVAAFNRRRRLLIGASS